MNMAHPGSSLSRSPLVMGVLKWLSDRDKGDLRWLVVLDNADIIDHHLKAIIPQGPRGHVIVTSQTTDAFSLFDARPQRVHVESMKDSEAHALLTKRITVHVSVITATNRQYLDAIAQRVGCLALAVDMAGAVLAEGLCCHDQSSDAVSEEILSAVLRRYVQDFDAHRDDMLKDTEYNKPSDYRKTVWTA